MTRQGIRGRPTTISILSEQRWSANRRKRKHLKRRKADFQLLSYRVKSQSVTGGLHGGSSGKKTKTLLSNLIGSEVLYFFCCLFEMYVYCQEVGESTVESPKSETYQISTLCQWSDDLEYLCRIKCVQKIVYILQVCLLPGLVTLVLYYTAFL